MGTDSTQPQTQPQTTPPETHDPPEIHPDCWGLLVPCSAGQPSGIIQLKKRAGHGDQPPWPRSGLEEHSFKVGRGTANDFVLPGQKISSQHCTLTWSGRAGDKPSKENAVVVHDNSSNGTFINGKRIGKTKKSLLTPGDELSFGLPGQDLDDLDYRYIFRRPTEALAAVGNGVFLEYELGPALGRGAFATVITKSRFVHNPRSRQMFEREVAIMKEFDHPHICKLVAHFEDESTIWLILELISGGDLLEAVINENGLSEEETRQLATEMCLAMEYSHSKGVTHRDLKPENILLTDTVPRHAKIADFGLAKAVDSGTFLKTFCGTPTYLAPEVVLRAQDAGYNELVDSWSLGVIVWSMLTNTVPFTEDEEDMYTRFQRRQVDWSQVLSFGLSHDCIDWMKRMLAQDPNHRMGLAQALEHPWLAPLANTSGYDRPQPRHRTTTPTDSSGSTAGNSVAGSLISYDPFSSSQALASSQALERCSQDMSSMVIDTEDDDSTLGSASLVSGAVSVLSGFTATTHASDTSNLRLASKFSEYSQASLHIPGRFPQPSAAAQVQVDPYPLRSRLRPLNYYETPEMLNTGLLQVPNAPLRSGKAPVPVADDSMQTDSSWDEVSRGIGGESTLHPQLQREFTPSPRNLLDTPHTPANQVTPHPSTPNGYVDRPANGQPPHLQFNESPHASRQMFQQPAVPAHVPPYRLRPRPAGLSPLRPQQPRERVLPAHPGPMREPLPVAPSSPVTATPSCTTASSVKRTGFELEESCSELSEPDEGDSPPRGPTATVRPKRVTGQAPTRVSSRVRARMAGAALTDETPVAVKMPISGVGARRNNRRHTPLKPKIH
ncbi:kinase domain protein, partial [Rhizoctonia solani AG-3 Rhs1AP]